MNREVRMARYPVITSRPLKRNRPRLGVSAPQDHHRIAMISDHASPLAALGGEDSGGQNVYVAQVSKRLAELGHHVDVFTRRDSPILNQVVNVSANLRVIHVPAGPGRFVHKEKLLPWMESFTRFTHRFMQDQLIPYDIVHANFWLSGLTALTLRREAGVPFVITFHALGRVRRLFQKAADGFPDERFQIEDEIVRTADRIIAECPQDIQDLMGHYQAVPEKISMVPCGFDPAELWPVDKTSARRRLGLPENEFIILQLGRIVPRKGIDNVIRGTSAFIHSHHIPVRLLVVGGDSDEPNPSKTPEIGRLMRIAQEEGVADRVRFVGRSSREYLKDYYSAADVFVTTPWYEPFGITPLEAMACGTPVIGARVGGIQYSVAHQETGVIIPPNDPEKLAEQLAYLYLHPGIRKKMGRMGIRRVNERFTWAKVTDSICSIYHEVIRSRRRLAKDGQVAGHMIQVPARIQTGTIAND